MNEENLGVSVVVDGAVKCDSLPELGDSTVIVGGEGEAAGERLEGDQENHAAESELEFVGEDGGGEAIASEDGGPIMATEEEGVNRVVYAESEAVAADGVAAPASDESPVNEEGDELVAEDELEMKTEEGTVPAIDAKLETDVTESGPRMDARGDEIPVDPQIEEEDVEESTPMVDPKMEVADTDAGHEQQLPELQTDANVKGGELNSTMEESEVLNDDEKELSNEEHDEALGGAARSDEVAEDKSEFMENDSEFGIAERSKEVAEVNDSESAERSDESAEEKGNFISNDSEFEIAEKLTEVEEVKSDFMTEVPDTKIKTDGGDHLEQEQVQESSDGMGEASVHERNVDKSVAAEESQIVEDDNLSMKVSSDSKLDDEPSDDAEYKEDVLVKTDLLEGDIKLEDAEVETETGTNSVDSKTPEDDGKLETEDTMSDDDETAQDMYDSPSGLQDGEDETMVAEEETGTQDTEMETETEMAESGKSSGGKRKRAKLLKSPSITKAVAKGSRKTVGEDVCFICFDGGELVLCDRRGCPKAYHPSCVNRDEAFFKSKGRWNCGWHLCSICEKNARYMCYTCTFSLCRSCTKDATILCVRGNKGFCETCMRTVKLIENNEQGDNDVQIDFNDKSSWEFLFKDYYIELKAKLSLTSDEIAEAKNPWKGADMSGSRKIDSPEGGSASDDSADNSETIRPKRRKLRRQSKSKKGELVDAGAASVDKAASSSANSEWASRELLEFVSHMKNGDTSVLSQFDVQALLLEYIKRNKLRDPRRKSQIVCDSRLENLFGKPRVGHFEMLKLLESHFFVRDEQHDDLQGSVVDTENEQLDIDTSPETLTKGTKDKKRKSRKKGDNRGPQSNLDDYAAIDMHNIGLIYLRRKLMEDLLEDDETFSEKVIGTFVRIRISGSNQKQDLYRLVQVIGTSKAPELYKVGKKATDIMVEILNLDKTEIISIDTISNQEFTEDECKRLRQSIKCHLISPLTVGGILDKTMEIQVARVNDTIEFLKVLEPKEIITCMVPHCRDLRGFSYISHHDKMHYWLESETLRLSHLRDRASDLGRRKELRECIEKLQLLKTPEERRRRLEEIPEIHADPKMNPSYESEDNDNSDNEDARRDAFMRSRGSGFSKRGRGPISPGRDNYVKDSWSNPGKSTPSRNPSGNNFSSGTGHIGEIVNENSWNLEREKPSQESNNFDKLNFATKPESASGVASLPSQGSYSAKVAEPTVKINESEKIWQYQDPSGKVQGPFSMVQLRKWNNTGYFPANLKIWRATEKQENSVLLVDALAGKFPSETLKSQGSQQEIERSKTSQSSASVSNNKWFGNETANLPSPTPKQSNTGWSGGGEASHLTVKVQSPSVNGALPSPTKFSPNPATRSSNPTSVLNPVVQNTNFSPTPMSQHGISVNSAAPLHNQTASMNEPNLAPMQVHPPAPVPVVNTQNLPTDTQVWGSGAPQSGQGYGWAPPNAQSSSGSFPNPSSVQPDVWRPPAQSTQQNMHSPTTPNASWGVGPAVESNTTAMAVRPHNPNAGWGPMQGTPPNMGWVNPTNTNVNWVPTMQGGPPPPVNASGWVPPPGGNYMQGMVPGNTNPMWAPTQGWVGPPPVPGPAPGNGWGPPGGNVGPPPQGPGQANVNQGWAPWDSEQSHGGGGGQFSGPRGGGGRDSGFGGGRPWNNRGGGGGGGGGQRLLNKGEKLCPFNANGRCRKGPRCDFLHA